MKKIIVVSLINAVLATNAFAGGTHGMTEVSHDLRNELEQAKVYADEYKELYKEQKEENKKLKNENMSLNNKCNNCLREKAVLDGKLTSLTAENKDLNRRVGEWKAKAEMSEKTVIASSKTSHSSKIQRDSDVHQMKGRHNDDVDYVYEAGLFHRIFGTLVGAPVGAVVGAPIAAVRGSAAKGIDHADDFSDYMGPGTMGEAFGKVGGLGVGAISGALTGAVKGFTNGLVLGYKYPLSAESFSLDGDIIGDYDPYDFHIHEPHEMSYETEAEMTP
ncbi:MAG: hypothetical protein HRT47_05065 [Candidatus Caenarcaniphilales bacterium]|nr:hypothetical protein [Candidatus Caenarcaniphilales bacterium]